MFSIRSKSSASAFSLTCVNGLEKYRYYHVPTRDRRILTKKRTTTPAEIIFAGENISETVKGGDYVVVR